MRIIAITIALVACSGAPAKPGCGEGDLAQINGAEQGEIALKCGGQGVDCPARDEIHADYKKKREEWFLECQN
jgi:hypothetical protein